MTSSIFHPDFQKTFSKIRDGALREKILKHLQKIRENPEIGKPMMYQRKGTREVYIPPFRLSYSYQKEQNKIIFLNLYRKDEQ